MKKVHLKMLQEAKGKYWKIFMNKTNIDYSDFKLNMRIKLCDWF